MMFLTINDILELMKYGYVISMKAYNKYICM